MKTSKSVINESNWDIKLKTNFNFGDVSAFSSNIAWNVPTIRNMYTQTELLSTTQSMLAERSRGQNMRSINATPNEYLDSSRYAIRPIIYSKIKNAEVESEFFLITKISINIPIKMNKKNGLIRNERFSFVSFKFVGCKILYPIEI